MQVSSDEEVIFGRPSTESDQLIREGKPAGQEEAVNYEEAIASCGFGKFQKILLLICGWALASDSTEVQVVSFVLPAACDLNMTLSEKGWLNAIIFVGMMLGGYAFGGTADIKGRRYVLLWSMTINGVFGLASAFAPDFGWFLFLRLLSGIGVGAAMPVLFSYFVEFMTKGRRGPMIGFLASFWMVGNILTAAIAWIIIPKVHIGVQLGRIRFGSWRIFVAVGSIPSLSSALLFLFLPESPKFLQQIGKMEEAKKVMISIFRKNNGDITIPLEILNFADDMDRNDDENVRYVDPEMCTFCQMLCGALSTLKKVIQSTVALFRKPHTMVSIVLILVWCTLSFGYYGLWMWFPELFARIEEGKGGCGGTEPTLNNNSSVTKNLTCMEKVAAEHEIYFQSFLIAISNLPGNIATIVLIDRIGRRQLLAASMVLSSVAVFFFWFVNTKVKMLVMSCFFSGLTVAGWNALDNLALENYPTNLRASAFGLQASVGRISAIIGNIVFGELIGVHCAIPLLTVAALLCVGGLAALKLPRTDDSILS